jgi:hypothetical protein
VTSAGLHGRRVRASRGQRLSVFGDLGSTTRWAWEVGGIRITVVVHGGTRWSLKTVMEGCGDDADKDMYAVWFMRMGFLMDGWGIGMMGDGWA